MKKDAELVKRTRWSHIFDATFVVSQMSDRANQKLRVLMGCRHRVHLLDYALLYDQYLKEIRSFEDMRR